MTTRNLRAIVFVNRNRTLEVTDEMFHLAFKPEQFKKQYGHHGELILETEADHLNRFLGETGIRYHSFTSMGETRHYFQKTG